MIEHKMLRSHVLVVSRPEKCRDFKASRTMELQTSIYQGLFRSFKVSLHGLIVEQQCHRNPPSRICQIIIFGEGEEGFYDIVS